MGATAGLIIAGVGTGLSAVGQVRAGGAQRNVDLLNASNIENTSELNAQLIEQGTQANAGVLDFNAGMEEAQAKDAIRRGRDAERLQRQQTRAIIGSQRADYAAQGVDVTYGSPLEVQ